MRGYISIYRLVTYRKITASLESSRRSAPHEKAQASDEIYKRAAHPGSKLNQKKCRVGRACSRVCVRTHACMYVYMYVGAALPPHVRMYVYVHTYVLEMNVRM